MSIADWSLAGQTASGLNSIDVASERHRKSHFRNSLFCPLAEWWWRRYVIYVRTMPSYAYMHTTTLQKKLTHFPISSRDVTDQIKLFPPRKSLISDIPAGDEKTANPFLQCREPSLPEYLHLNPYAKFYEAPGSWCIPEIWNHDVTCIWPWLRKISFFIITVQYTSTRIIINLDPKVVPSFRHIPFWLIIQIQSS